MFWRTERHLRAVVQVPLHWPSRAVQISSLHRLRPLAVLQRKLAALAGRPLSRASSAADRSPGQTPGPSGRHLPWRRPREVQGRWRSSVFGNHPLALRPMRRRMRSAGSCGWRAARTPRTAAAIRATLTETVRTRAAAARLGSGGPAPRGAVAPAANPDADVCSQFRMTLSCDHTSPALEVTDSRGPRSTDDRSIPALGAGNCHVEQPAASSRSRARLLACVLG